MRRAAWGGIAGPVAFVTAWSVLGTRLAGYDPLEDPISRLAAVGAPTRAAMSGGFLAFAGGVSLLATTLPRRVAVVAAANAVATVGVAALPLGGTGGDEPHAVAAGLAYASLAALPLVGAGTFGGRRTAQASVVAGVASGAALLASAVASSKVGLLQRTGLTIGDAWIVATSAWLLSGGGRRAGARRR